MNCYFVITTYVLKFTLINYYLLIKVKMVTPKLSAMPFKYEHKVSLNLLTANPFNVFSLGKSTGSHSGVSHSIPVRLTHHESYSTHLLLLSSFFYVCPANLL